MKLVHNSRLIKPGLVQSLKTTRAYCLSKYKCTTRMKTLIATSSQNSPSPQFTPLKTYEKPVKRFLINKQPPTRTLYSDENQTRKTLINMTASTQPPDTDQKQKRNKTNKPSPPPDTITYSSNFNSVREELNHDPCRYSPLHENGWKLALDLKKEFF